MDLIVIETVDSASKMHVHNVVRSSRSDCYCVMSAAIYCTLTGDRDQCYNLGHVRHIRVIETS